MNRLVCLSLCIFAFSFARAQQPIFHSNFGNNGEIQINEGSSAIIVAQNISDIRAMAYFSNGEMLGAFILGTPISGTPYPSAIARQYGLIKFLPNGSTDSSFGVNGIVTLAPAGSFTNFQSVQIQPDGKILVAGTGDGITDLIRLLPDGQLDASFNSTGILTFEILRSILFEKNFESDVLDDVLIQNDGKYLLLGELILNDGSGYSAPAVTRINTDGSLDSSFGVKGVATINALSGIHFKGHLDPNGEIMLISSQSNNGNSYTAQTLRLKSNGQPDSSFGTNALMTYTRLGSALCNQLLGTANGSYYMLANSQSNATPDTGYFIIRFQPNGLLDTSFGTNGRFNSITQGGLRTKLLNMDTLPDGSLIVLAGNDSSRTGSYLINVTSAGTLNAGFGTAGIENLPNSQAWCVWHDPYNSKIFTYNAAGTFSLSSFNADGTADGSFGKNGAITINVKGDGVTALQGMGITSDKKIIAVGHYQNSPSFNDSARLFIKRYLPNGTPDNTFGNQGSIHWTLYTGNTYQATIDAMAMTSDDGFVLGGVGDTTAPYLSVKAYIQKRRADGSVDSSFGYKGIWLSPWNYGELASHAFGALVVQPDGKILYAATIDSFPGFGIPAYPYRTVIGRLTPQGQPDPTFGNNGSLLLPGYSYSANFNIGDAIALRPNGDILLTCSTDSGIQVIQLLPNGTIDPSFGNQGVFTHLYTPAGYTIPEDIKVKPDSSIIVLYQIYPQGQTYPYEQTGIIHLFPNGQMDSTFPIIASDPAGPLVANQLQLQDDGRILIPGIVLSAVPHFVVMRLRPDGWADNTFGPNGVVTIGNRNAVTSSAFTYPLDFEMTSPVLMTRVDSADYIFGGTMVDFSVKGYLTSFYAKDSLLPNDADTMNITLTDTTYPSPCHEIKLSWIARNDTTSHYFSVQRSSQFDGIYTPIAMIPPTTHLHGPLQYYYTDSFPLPNYNWYQVKLVMGGDSLLTSNQIDRFSDTSNPGKIGKPAASYTVSQGIYSTVITWKVNNQKTLDSINVLRSMDNGVFTEAGWQSPLPAATQNAYSFADPDPLQPGHIYSYKVELFGTNCVNAISDTVSIKLPAIDTATGPGSGNGSGNTSPSNPTDTATSVKVYPNPATSTLNVATPPTFDSGVIEIISFDGKILYRQPVTAPANGVLSVNIGWLDPGIYYLKLINAQKVWVSTFVKT